MQYSTCVLRKAGVLMLIGAAAAAAQDGGNRLRQLNNVLLRFHAEVERAGPAQAAAIRSQAAPVIKERAQALEVLIQDNPRQALSFALPPEVLARLRAAFSTSAGGFESHGVWRGQVERLIFDDASLASNRELILLKDAQERLEVHFADAQPANLKSGDVLEVSGVRAGNKVAVTAATVEAAAGGSCGPTGEQKSIILLATFPGVAPPAISPASIADTFFSPVGRSVTNFWREASYGKTWASGNVVGWLTLDRVYSCSEYYLLRDAAIRAADSLVDFRQYSRIFVIFPSPGSCSWAGIANVGCSSAYSPSGGTFTASSAWMLADFFSGRDQAVKLATHEGGHNLTLGHASTLDYGAEAAGPIGTLSSAGMNEYGDLFSTMGSWNLGHYSVPHKVRMNWLASGSNVQTVESSGLFTLEPIELNPAGIQGLKVRRGTGNNAWLWVEYRQPIGAYDSAIGSQAYSGALIHYEEASGSKTFLLDFTPETASWSDPALAAGKTWVDPYSNLSLSVQSASPNALTVTVNYGALTCVRGNPTITLSPSNPSTQPGLAVSYTAILRNNDSAGCPASTFGISSTAPSGWSSSLSASALNLAPGQSGTAALSKTPPLGTLPGTYAVGVVGSDVDRTATAGANCTVTLPPPPLTVNVATNSAAYAARSTVSITATVLNGGAAAPGATVRFTMVKPDGTKVSKDATTGANGAALWSYRLGPKDVKGSYTVTAAAVKGSQNGTGTVTFVVN